MANAVARRSDFAALLLALAAPCVAMAEPRLLTRPEMDVVTAGGIVVEVEAYARAAGAVALTRTDARVFMSRSEEGMEVGAGFSEALAYACCSDGASVAVDSSAAGGGAAVHGRSFSHVFHGAALTTGGAFQRFAFGYSAAFLLAASSDGLLSVRKLDEALGDLSRELVGDGRSDDGLVTGSAFAPVYTAGLQWRAARHLSGDRYDLSPAAIRVASQRLTRARQAVSWK